MEPLSPKLVGARVRRVEDRRLLTGQGRFVDDYHPPGLLHAAFLRSPHAHARIVSLDPSAARALPGAVAVVTGEELGRWAKPMRALSKMPDYKMTTFPPLALGKVRFAGEAVAVVVAQSRYVGAVRGIASIIALLIALIVGFYLGDDYIFQALLVGVAAVPLAPVAKDLVTALQSASKAIRTKA